jgi:hypothetical protein
MGILLILELWRGDGKRRYEPAVRDNATSCIAGRNVNGESIQIAREEVLAD